MMFGEVISQVVFATCPVNEKFAFLGRFFDPVVVHVDGFGVALFDSVIDNAAGSHRSCLFL